MVSHDNIAENIGVTCQSFQEMNENKTEDIMRTVMEYVKIVRAATGTGTGTGTGSESRNPSLTINLGTDGFPVAPCPPSWDTLSKESLERLYRSYITHHYRRFFSYEPVI